MAASGIPGGGTPDDPPEMAREKITLLAVALAAGIAVGWCRAGEAVWPWLAAAAASLAVGAVFHVYQSRIGTSGRMQV